MFYLHRLNYCTDFINGMNTVFSKKVYVQSIFFLEKDCLFSPQTMKKRIFEYFGCSLYNNKQRNLTSILWK